MIPTARKKTCKYRLLGLALAAAIGGCGRWQSWNWRGPGYNDETTGWTNKMRPNSGAGGSGMDNRAREIEQNLGYR